MSRFKRVNRFNGDKGSGSKGSKRSVRKRDDDVAVHDRRLIGRQSPPWVRDTPPRRNVELPSVPRAGDDGGGVVVPLVEPAVLQHFRAGTRIDAAGTH